MLLTVKHIVHHLAVLEAVVGYVAPLDITLDDICIVQTTINGTEREDYPSALATSRVFEAGSSGRLGIIEL